MRVGAVHGYLINPTLNRKNNYSSSSVRLEKWIF